MIFHIADCFQKTVQLMLILPEWADEEVHIDNPLETELK